MMRRTILLLSLALFLALSVALAACGGTDTTDTSTSGSPNPPAATETPPSSATHVEHAIEVFRDVPYLAEPEGGKGTTLLDVYAPKDAGPWPLVVLLHGGGETKDGYVGWATDIAERGAVVYVPTWSPHGR